MWRREVGDLLQLQSLGERRAFIGQLSKGDAASRPFEVGWTTFIRLKWWNFRFRDQIALRCKSKEE